MLEETARLAAPFKCLSAACYHETMCGISVISTMLLGRGQEERGFGYHPIISFIRVSPELQVTPLSLLFIHSLKIHSFLSFIMSFFLSYYFTADIS